MNDANMTAIDFERIHIGKLSIIYPPSREEKNGDDFTFIRRDNETVEQLGSDTNLTDEALQ